MINYSVNILAVIVAAIIPMIVGMFWYHPKVFGAVWMKAAGITPKDVKKAKKKSMGPTYAIGFISKLFTSYILAIFINMLSVRSLLGGIVIGFLAWFGFVAASKLESVLWERQPMKLYLINISYSFVVLILMGALLAVWH